MEQTRGQTGHPIATGGRKPGPLGQYSRLIRVAVVDTIPQGEAVSIYGCSILVVKVASSSLDNVE